MMMYHFLGRGVLDFRVIKSLHSETCEMSVWSQVLAHGFFKDFFYVQVLNFFNYSFSVYF